METDAFIVKLCATPAIENLTELVPFMKYVRDTSKTLAVDGTVIQVSRLKF